MVKHGLLIYERIPQTNARVSGTKYDHWVLKHIYAKMHGEVNIKIRIKKQNLKTKHRKVFLKPIRTNLCCPNVLGCVAFSWSTVNLPGATLLEKTNSPSLSQPICPNILSLVHHLFSSWPSTPIYLLYPMKHDPPWFALRIPCCVIRLCTGDCLCAMVQCLSTPVCWKCASQQ